MLINNIEVVGLPEPDDDNTDESNVLEVINSLDHDYGDGFTSNDINLSCRSLSAKGQEAHCGVQIEIAKV